MVIVGLLRGAGHHSRFPLYARADMVTRGRSKVDMTRAASPAHRHQPDAETVESNARLTAMTAAVLFFLFAAEGVTILRLHVLLTAHVVIGMVLVPVVLVKVISTLWRFARYYLGDPAYRRKGPPPVALRLLGPFVVVLTAGVLGTGIVLLVNPGAGRSQWLFLHKATFVLWLVAMTLHVLGHLIETARLAPRDFYRRTRSQIRGAGARQWVLVAAIGVGVVLAVAIAPSIGSWRMPTAGANANVRPAPTTGGSALHQARGS
jgi:hypothetical protein